MHIDGILDTMRWHLNTMAVICPTQLLVLEHDSRSQRSPFAQIEDNLALRQVESRDANTELGSLEDYRRPSFYLDVRQACRKH